MLDIKPELVRELQQILKDDGVDLTYEETLKVGSDLTEFYDLLLNGEEIEPPTVTTKQRSLSLDKGKKQHSNKE